MPSDQNKTHKGYLQNILVNGTKPFYYRRGIRSLLGIPEQTSSGIAYPLPMPPSGFKYTSTHPLAEMRTVIQAEQKEIPSFDLEARPLKLTQFQNTKRFLNPKGEENLQSSMPEESSSLFSKLQKKQKLIHPVEQIPYSSKATTEQKESLSQTQLTKIEIPGFSDKVRTFPPIESLKKEESQTLHSSPNESEVEEKLEKQQDTPDEYVKSSKKSEMKIRKKDRPEKSKTIEFMRTQPRMPLQQKANIEQFSESESHHPENKPLIFQKQAGQITRPNEANHNAEAKIEQLRQTGRSLNQKSALKETSQPSEQSDAEKESSSRPEKPASAAEPVVIMKRQIIQTKTPSAFWERSYLSHVFRMRRLR